ncbi:uncharacterized protein SPPG_01539 [Spizellomyces punctatus DAOM BR117]|uniref:Cache domain-containing protein n=1 Tax=Spizellomyces punctatus (strain DAOM BR117) TaxID=645134 RepID=A0A0L0HSM1_SPIPD|nr:uncharacterized protein SPPG_01539 [Spizellomyces punctatus DAOM BR117]KND04098.1 hypothetical protein SPPG_01539 [Spizellomyces punctatus DAOM BR117]|eukprot:XP_016612137.1 hypothetical protein SPPG_01539 [Spizellomyces punctatus DAOM BR117]
MSSTPAHNDAEAGSTRVSNVQKKTTFEDEEGQVRESKRRRLIRLPFVVPLIGITIAVAAIISAVISKLMFNCVDTTIDDMTSILRTSTVERAHESVQSIVQISTNITYSLVMDRRVRMFLTQMQANDTTPMMSDPDVYSRLWASGANYSFIHNVALMLDTQEYLAIAVPRSKIFVFQDSTTFNATLNTTNLYRRGVGGVNSNGDVQLVGASAYQSPHLWPPFTKPSFASGNSIGKWQSAVPAGTEFYYQIMWWIWPDLPPGKADPSVQPFAHSMVAMSVSTIEAFLQTIKISPNAVVSLWDPNSNNAVYCRMIAASVAGVSGNRTYRYSVFETPQSLIRQTANYMRSLYPSAASIPDNLASTFIKEDGSGVILVNSRRVTDPYGLNWLLVVSVPRDDYLGTVNQTRKTVIAAVAGTVVGMTVVAVCVAYALVYPIRKLSETMVDATAFDFSAIRDGYLTQNSLFEPLEIARCKEVFSIMLTRFATAIQVNKKLAGRSVGAASARQSQVRDASMMQGSVDEAE